MKFCQFIVLFALLAVGQSVILSLEESEPGLVDYRYFYFTIEDFDGTYSKPYFTIVDNTLTRPYGALGSLTCPSTTSGVAVYLDIDDDGLKEWSCRSINVLPFANEGNPASPPICSSTTSSGTPTLWNNTLGEWYCAGFNHILTAARRGDENPCATADFMYYDGFIDEIRCIDPTEINEADTATLKRDVDEIAERVDVTDDKKWHSTVTTIDITESASATWHQFKWTPSINYDLSSSYSLRPSPPIVYPWDTEVIAVTFASFRVNGYNWNILTPTTSDSFIGEVYKLQADGSTVVVSNTLTFNSVTATSGQVTFGLSTLASSTATAGEAFVAGVSARTWTPFLTNADRHVISISLWVQMNEKFTDFFFTL